MKTTDAIAFALMSVLAACAGPVLAQDTLDAKQVEALMEKNACTACHQLDAKVLGPSWKDVAAKYKGDVTASDKVAERVIKGSSGIWGAIPMPPNAALTSAEAKGLVNWVLAQ